jgi:hypothetical protein
MDEPQPLFSDREILVALLQLVGALAERLTGERPSVRLENGRGDFVWVCPNSSRVRWRKADVQGRCAGQPAPAARRSQGGSSPRARPPVSVPLTRVKA